MRAWKWKNVITAGIALCLMAPFGAKAEALAATPLSEVSLEEIVITATKTEKKLEDAPGSVTVIKKEDMEKQNIQTVDDALNAISGVYVKRSKGIMDSTAGLRMRGFNGDQYAAVLIDGQPINDAYTGGLEWSSLPVENIERIEVIRGAVSGLHGGNAMGGVVNIITKTPQKLEANLSGGYGSNQSWRRRFSVGDRFWDKLSLRLGYEEESTDGWATTPVVQSITSGAGNVTGGYAMKDSTGTTTKWVVGDKGKNGGWRQSFDGKIVLDYSDTGQVSFSGLSGRNKYDYGRPHSYMGTLGDTTTYAVVDSTHRARFQPYNFIYYTGIGSNDTDIYNATIKDAIGKVNIHGQVGSIQGDDRYTTQSGSGLRYYDDCPGTLKITKNETWFTEWNGDIPFGESHVVTLGGSYRLDDSDTNDYNVPFYRSYSHRGSSTFYAGGKEKTWAVFAQDEWRVFDPFTLYLGFRYDSYKVYDGSSGVPGSKLTYKSNTESEVSPKFAGVWKVLADTTLRASVGHAFRPPTLYELYRTWQSGTTTYYSNPTLKPETVWAYELGVEQYFFDKKTRISLTGYRNDIKDMIYYKTETGGGVTNKYRMNAGKARTYGLELEASQKLTEMFTLWGNYTFTHAKITDNPTDPASEGKRVTGIPWHTFNIGLDSQYKWVKCSLIGRYFSKIYNATDNSDRQNGVYGTYEESFVVDAKLTVSPYTWQGMEMDLSFFVDNIFDKKYYQYYKMDGRSFFTELCIRY